jgi:hypothetical protein
MNNRIARSQFVIYALVVACLAVVADCIVAGRWPGVLIFALGGAIFCGVSPRMTGPFGFSGGGTRIGGTFDDNTKVVVVGKLSPTDPENQPEGENLAEKEAPPSSTRPSED